MLMAVNERTLKMGSAPIFQLLVSMAVPGLLGTLTTYLYRTVDQIFVGNFVGRTALLSRLTDGEEIPAKRLINISKKSLTE